MTLLRLKRLILGQPLLNERATDGRLPNWKGRAILSTNALSSTAYATEEILIALVTVSATATLWSIPIALAICALLLVIALSFRKTLDAFPHAGGAYAVTKANLGTLPG